MSENTNIRITVQAWAEITIKQWLDEINKLNIGNTNALYDSFTHHIISSSGGDPERIQFAFNFYGRFVDMGVGVNESYGNSKGKRKPKYWYSKALYFNLKRLGEILAEKYARKSALIITDNLRNI